MRAGLISTAREYGAISSVPIFALADTTISLVLAQGCGVQTASIIAVEPLARLYRVRLEPELRVEQQAGVLLLKQASSTR